MPEKFYIFVLKEYERKLMELMGDKYADFAKDIAKAGFKQEVDEMAEGDFKDFILDNFDDITRL